MESRALDKCRWGILATGNIARQFARELKFSNSGKLAGIASRQFAHAEKFANKFGGKAFADYKALIESPDIDAVYIATPHSSHFQWAMRCLEHHKPVLCEKPLAINHGEVLRLFGAASRNKTLLVEALMYLLHPRMQLVKQKLESGVIGDITHFSSSFGFAMPYSPEHRLYDNQLGGGSILDIGIYPLSATQYLLGAPKRLTGKGRLSDSKVDCEAHATLDYGSFQAELHCAIDLDLPWEIKITGTKGEILVNSPWHPGPDNQAFSLITPAGKISTYASEEQRPIYALEADHFSDLLNADTLESPILSQAFSQNLAFWSDRWRSQVGVKYASDQLQACKLTLTNDASALPSLAFQGLDKPVSQLFLGTDNQIDAATMAAMADAFFEHGGNCFDTAYIYSNGLSEKLLGKWINSRGVREDIVLLSKGAHTPHCTPETIATQLETTLERLQTDYLDLYCLHRDDESIPVDEWIDALNEQVNLKRIKLFGGSNWSSARIDQSNQYAVESEQQPFNLISNNFSLARMINPVWEGCISSSEEEFRKWHENEQMPLLCWSSQARGFFLNWEESSISSQRHGADPTLKELKRVWVDDYNLERKQRAITLADQLDCDPIQIALAYVLHQNFPIYALIGPRSIRELDHSIQATQIKLTQEQVNWLDLRDEK